MELNNAMAISASGLRAQGMRMRIISENIANADTAAETPNDLPYQKKTINFKNELDRARGHSLVKVDDINQTDNRFTLKHEPNHPAADQNGYVKMPDVNPMMEMVDMQEAQRSYEAGLKAIELARGMRNRTVDLLRGSN